MGKIIDLTGQKFGRLTVVRRGEDYINLHGKKFSQWWCLCDCQLELPEEERNLVLKIGSSLKRGNTKSCGCLHKEIASKKLREIRTKKNIYDLTHSYGLCYDESKENCWKFDLEDYEMIKDYYWTSTNGYASAKDKQNNITVTMHRIIMKCLPFDNTYVDHINHDITDNRKINLRLCTNFQNNANKGLQKNNSTGVTGVVLDKRTNKWVAQIIINRKHIHLGVYKDFEEAVKARKEAEEKYYGEFSFDNSSKLNRKVG